MKYTKIVLQSRNILRLCYNQEIVSLKEVKLENVISVKLAKNVILNAVSCCGGGGIINYLLEFFSLSRENLNKFLFLEIQYFWCKYQPKFMLFILTFKTTVSALNGLFSLRTWLMTPPPILPPSHITSLLRKRSQ